MTCRPMIGAVAAATLSLSTTRFAQQGQLGTAQEAKAMLDKAVAAVKANKDAALVMFNNGEGGFKTVTFIHSVSISAMASSLPVALTLSDCWGQIRRMLKDPTGKVFGPELTPRRRSRKVKSAKSATCFQGPAPTRRRFRK